MFFDLVKQSLEIFINDFSIYRDSFDDYFTNLENVLKRCQDKHLTLNGEKFILR